MREGDTYLLNKMLQCERTPEAGEMDVRSAEVIGKCSAIMEVRFKVSNLPGELANALQGTAEQFGYSLFGFLFCYF